MPLLRNRTHSTLCLSNYYHSKTLTHIVKSNYQNYANLRIHRMFTAWIVARFKVQFITPNKWPLHPSLGTVEVAAHVFRCVEEDITGSTQAYGVLYNTLVTAAVNGKVEVHAKKHLCWETCYSILVFEWVVSIKADITDTSQTNHAINVSNRVELQMKTTDGN